MALGPNASEADRKKHEDLKRYIKKTDGKSLEKRFPEVANLKKYGLKKVGKRNSFGVYYTGDQPTTDKMEDLNLELNRKVKKHGGLSTVFTTDDGKKMTVKNWYLGELRKIDNPKAFGDYEFYDPAYDFFKDVPIEEEIKNDGGGKNDSATVNLDQQKLLVYDRETKLFNEVDVKNMPKGSILVAINGQLTNEGLELKDELNIDSFENFNYKLYNRNFENKQTVDKNKNLLESDLELGAFTPSTPEDIKRERKLDLEEDLDKILKGVDKTKQIPQSKINEMLLAVGFKPEEAKIMAAVAMAESAGDPMIDTVKSGLDPKKENEFSIGLFQLNMVDAFLEERLRLFDIESTDELYDPIVNVIAAKRLFDQQGFGAWGAYTNNSYKKFLTD